MRFARVVIVVFFLIRNVGVYGQSCNTPINHTVINFSCGITCGNVSLQVPDLKSTSDYSLTTIPYVPYAYITPGGNELPVLYSDDIYSAKISLPFSFCFYDSVFSKVVVGSNGLITFDSTNASCFNAWNISPTIPYAGGNACGIGGQSLSYYPRASIMGVYTDLDPRNFPVSPSDRKIEWRIEGVAPCRKFIASFYHIGVFGNNTCGNSSPNTFQIVLHESTAIIEIFIEQKQCLASTNSGRAILGIQDWTRTKAIAAPGKNSSQWTAVNEGYRFVPSGGGSRFLSSQLLNLSGTVIATATTNNSTPGLIDLSFQNICPTRNSEQFIVKTTYTSCNDPLTTLVYNDTITINKTLSLNATATTTNINCGSGATGTIIVNVPANSGVPPFQYSLNGGPYQSSNTFSGLPTGNYTVVATDINGCSSTLNVAISRTGNLGVGYSVTNSSCSGVSNGSITILPPSTYTPIQYSLNGGAPQTSNIFNGLAAGSYTINITDAVGCTGSTTVNVTQGGGVTASFVTTPTSCSGTNNGSITVTPGGGVLPYQYSLDGGPYQSINIFNGLAAGNYTVTVKDVNGCNNLFNVTVNPGTPLTAVVTKNNVSCNGGASGSMTVFVTNGSAPYQYSLNNVNWQTSNSFTGLTAGTYTVYYRDNNACINSQSVVITEPSVLNISFATVPVACFGQSNGQITITPSGGTSPYVYSLDGVNYQPGNVFNVPAGAFTVYVQDNNGCIKSQSTMITEPVAISLNITSQDASCNGGADGQINATGSGGTGNLQYSINGTSFQSSGSFNVLPGNYTVTVKDANNCTASQPIIVGLSSNLSISPAADVTICEGESVQLNVATNANQFSWTSAGTLNNAFIQNPIANPNVTTQYVVTATFGLCSGRDTLIVNVNPAPIPEAGPDGDICYGQNYQLQGSGGVQFMWSPAAAFNSASINNPIVSPQKTATYSLSVIDSNGCFSLVQDQVTVMVTPPIVVVTNPKDTVVFDGDQFQLKTSSAATDYIWTPAIGLSDPYVPDPILTVTTDITFTVVASTSAGCSGSNTVTIKVFKGPEIYMPTGFTPNGDGRNDRFRPIPVGIATLNYFRVYNRWGQLLYSTKVFDDGWDGRIGGIDQPSGTYAWMVEGVARNGKLITKKGTVTLIR